MLKFYRACRQTSGAGRLRSTLVNFEGESPNIYGVSLRIKGRHVEIHGQLQIVESKTRFHDPQVYLTPLV